MLSWGRQRCCCGSRHSVAGVVWVAIEVGERVTAVGEIWCCKLEGERDDAGNTGTPALLSEDGVHRRRWRCCREIEKTSLQGLSLHEAKRGVLDSSLVRARAVPPLHLPEEGDLRSQQGLLGPQRQLRQKSTSHWASPWAKSLVAVLSSPYPCLGY